MWRCLDCLPASHKGVCFKYAPSLARPKPVRLLGKNGFQNLVSPSGIGSWRYLTGAVQAFSYLGEDDEAAKLYPLTTQAIDTGTIMLHYGCFDLFEKIAGIAATAARDWPAAAAHFENALKQAEAIPHKLDQCEVRYWYGKMLAERSASGDRERARELLSDAIKGYRSIGMPLHLEMAEELRAKL